MEVQDHHLSLWKPFILDDDVSPGAYLEKLTSDSSILDFLNPQLSEPETFFFDLLVRNMLRRLGTRLSYMSWLQASGHFVNGFGTPLFPSYFIANFLSRTSYAT